MPNDDQTTPAGEPNGGRDPSQVRNVVGEIVAGVAVAAILAGIGAIRSAVTGESLRTVILSTGGIGVGLGLLALLTLVIIVFRPVPTPPWFANSLAATATALVVSIGAMGVALLVMKPNDGPGPDPGPDTTTTSPTTTTVAPAGGTACEDPPVRLTAPDEADADHVVVIDITCPAPEGRTYHLISEILDIGTPVRHTEYYVVDFPLPTPTGVDRYSWNLDVNKRRLYVVAVTPAQEEQLMNFVDDDAPLILELPPGLAPISNVLEHPGSGGGG